jgi:hypothetical protein
VAFFVVTVYATYALMPARPGQPSHVPGLDFVSFYTAGNAVREGRAQDLYDFDATRRFQSSLQRRDGLPIGKLYSPWWNPPVYALMFVPLSTMSFFHALGAWLAVNIVCTGIAVWMLCRMLPTQSDTRSWALVPVLVALSMPFMATLTHGQNAGTSLLLVTVTVHFWRQGRSLPAGLVCGLLFFKPQLAVVLAGVMVVDLGIGAGIGIAVTGAALLTTNLLFLPGTLSAFLHQVPANLHYVQDQSTYPWARHVTPKALFRVLIQGHGVGQTSPIVSALSHLATAMFTALLARAAFKFRGQRFRRDYLITATIVATPVIMPFYFDYDLLLLAVPAVLIAREGLTFRNLGEDSLEAQPRKTLTKPTVLFSLLYIALLLNPDLTEALRINFASILLMTLSATVISRTNLGETTAESAELQRLAA